MTTEINSTQENDKTEIFLKEYEATQEMALHYDSMNMQFSTYISAAVFLLWGLVLQIDDIKKASFLIVMVELFTTAILTMWIQYITIHRRIVVMKFDRIHEIEKKYDMLQHRMFRYDERRRLRGKSLRRPGGHTIEIILYYVLVGFGVIIALWAQSPWPNAGYLTFLLSLLPLLPLQTLGRWAISLARIVAGLSIKRRRDNRTNLEQSRPNTDTSQEEKRVNFWSSVIAYLSPFVFWWGFRCKADVVAFIDDYRPRWYWKPVLRSTGYKELGLLENGIEDSKSAFDST